MLSKYVNEKNVYMFTYVFQICVGFVLSKCLNVKKYIWNAKYIIPHRIERLQTTKRIQYNIHNTKSCELPNFFHIFLNVVLVSCYQIVWMKKICICFPMFFKSSVGWCRAIKLFKKNTLGMRIERIERW